MNDTICVCGAGTMGRGIALLAAQSGISTVLFDVNDRVLDEARTQIHNNLTRLVEKNKITSGAMEAIIQKILFTGNIQQCRGELIIEAIVEKEEAKISLINELAGFNNRDTIFATNTSSLSITSIQSKVIFPGRVVGMHFFNPAYIMKLVEVVKGKLTDTETVDRVVAIGKSMGKIPVICKDTPGFIVNRIARHYYLESLKIAEEGIATFENIDKILESSGFKMGPFKLMDLIGMDVNLAVTRSLYEAFDKSERFKPSSLQEKKVEDNQLGKKTGSGFYSY